ncbi:conserved protein of unknown function [Pseudomonas inefficax]|uniref:Uncharacterized protein n=1 Tax=Pseudomonas inefficax TaxID=2078786 RepID=A0AAQ1P7V2_9PSED|nr:conserved protein of unknown function [Pseudomonas inefficax]
MAESRRRTAQVYSDIEHITGHYPYEFALRLMYLVMQAAQYMPARAGVVVLDEVDGTLYEALEDRVVEAFEEESAVIGEYVWLEQKDFRYCEGCCFH